MSEASAILFTFLGCASNAFFLETLVKDDPGSGNLITFLQFLFIAIKGFLFTSKCGTAKLHISKKYYFILVVMFFLTNVSNNYAFHFNIPMPLHMIFRSGSLVANMIMGMIILKKTYTWDKYLSVFMITLGIAICTIVSSTEIKSLQAKNMEHVKTTPWDDLFWWIIGICLLTFALFLSARMGIYQEVLFKHQGKHPEEAMYYTHMLALPFFLTMAPNLWNHLKIAMSSESLMLPVIGISLPKSIAYQIGNVLTQYVCISSVYVLTTECSSLTVTLVLTLRKFVSLILSILYFNNSFTLYHWVSALLVFLGTLIFTEVILKIHPSTRSMPKDKKID